MARALGGECVNDLPNAELGTIELTLTEAGRNDPIFGQLPVTFTGQAGHEDHVVALPPDAVLLASSPRVPEQAFRFAGRPIYCTQFHPELDRRRCWSESSRTRNTSNELRACRTTTSFTRFARRRKRIRCCGDSCNNVFG